MSHGPFPTHYPFQHLLVIVLYVIVLYRFKVLMFVIYIGTQHQYLKSIQNNNIIKINFFK